MHPVLLADVSFDDFGLDSRIRKAIHKLGWTKPTLIQASALPLALQGKDVLARASTGTGKTATFVLPILHRLLLEKKTDVTEGIKALILVPSSELCVQIKSVIDQMCHYIPGVLESIVLTSDTQLHIQKSQLSTRPEIVIGTPVRVLEHLTKKNLKLSGLKIIVIDEADLVLSYGHKQDLESIAASLPSGCQAFMMSATYSPDLEVMKNLILHSPAIIKMDDSIDKPKLKQYALKCQSEDRYLVLYVLLKLNIVRGKVIAFVNSIPDCFKLRIFLERFSIPAAVLNPELPHKSRYDIINKFNMGAFDLLIATDAQFEETDTKSPDEKDATKSVDEKDAAKSVDEKDATKSVDDKDTTKSVDAKDTTSVDEKDTTSVDDQMDEEHDSDGDKDLNFFPKWKQNRNLKMQKEYGVSRGIDFKNVSAVVNFDLPSSISSYMHRIGRTARANASGAALSLVTQFDGSRWRAIKRDQSLKGNALEPFKIPFETLNAFRYRVEDVLYSITFQDIQAAKIADIKREILNSDKLKSYFEANPNELEAINHAWLSKKRPFKYLQHLPQYLTGDISTESIIDTPQNSGTKKKKRARPKRSKDPLDQFARRGKKKKSHKKRRK
eukprot:TRINITY_DN7736_c0_g1_i1.p1 TRINITY_DN7736_c0_g1~~TRINITY_DN7736_c0_g1_i1.p1  ORF type:complete len:611 (-),score=111.77 TRINITY_DN7736_c0_g1_i1:38-1870(-)